MDEREPAKHREVFTDAERDIGKWFRRRVGSESRRRFGGMTNETGATGEQRDDDSERRTWVPEYLNPKERAADWPNHSVNGVPDRIDPRNFVGEKFEEIENACDSDNPGIPEHAERLVIGRERNPMEVDGKTRHKNGEIQIDAGERGETERHSKKIEPFHAGKYGSTRFVVTRVLTVAALDERHIFDRRRQVAAPASRLPPGTVPSTLCAMLDIRLIREKPDFVRERLATRGGGDEAKIDELLSMDADLRKGSTALQQLTAERKKLEKEIGARMKRGENATELINRVRGIGDRISQLETEVAVDESEELRRNLLLQIPNLPHASVPLGKDPTANKMVRSCGNKPKLRGEILDHADLGEKLKLLDLERAAKLSGTGFICFTGAGAKLERALINFMLDLHTREHGYTEISPPFLVRRDCMVGTSQLPKFEPDMYGLENGELFLAPTAEVPVTNFHREEILAVADLPKKFVAYTPCFRREAGSAGRETRGIIRVHQFDKVELVKITTAEKSYAELESLTSDAERVLQLLGLHYRVIELCTGDLGFGSAKTYDLEVWSPGQNGYLEVSSCSNFEDFQARRMNLRYKDVDGKNKFCHTLNGSGLALPRLFAALIETYQRPDGSIEIPKKLQPYFGNDEIRMTKDEGMVK